MENLLVKKGNLLMIILVLSISFASAQVIIDQDGGRIVAIDENYWEKENGFIGSKMQVLDYNLEEVCTFQDYGYHFLEGDIYTRSDGETLFVWTSLFDYDDTLLVKSIHIEDCLNSDVWTGFEEEEETEEKIARKEGFIDQLPFAAPEEKTGFFDWLIFW